MLEGYKRKNPRKPDIRQSITMVMLQRLIPSFRVTCGSHFESLVFCSVFVLSYFAMLRVSEVAVNSRSNETGHAINFEDVYCSYDKSELHIKICNSKTDKRYDSPTFVLIPYYDTNICPVRLFSPTYNFVQL